ncbi:unnamed protein product [Tilletia controversa]|uniref:Uncharacterized protein n=1 Tax=Tilletia caries TaxID=13290 RepID=A0ABN7IW01_9BASI|nr:hypothetical protein CF336_g4127 [Tilletia laevis]CAD6926303.1 unnamed protein product [Tilletia caries]CAD6956810.1 unnamed protein product [Tilletia controversa]CAD7059595.1 unnamed protein product [Tilletia caries]
MKLFKPTSFILLAVMSVVLVQASSEATSASPERDARQLQSRADIEHGITWMHFVAGVLGGGIGAGITASMVMTLMRSAYSNDDDHQHAAVSPHTRRSVEASASRGTLLYPIHVREGQLFELSSKEGEVGMVARSHDAGNNIKALAARTVSPEAVFGLSFAAGLPFGAVAGAVASFIIMKSRPPPDHRRDVADIHKLILSK